MQTVSQSHYPKSMRPTSIGNTLEDERASAKALLAWRPSKTDACYDDLRFCEAEAFYDPYNSANAIQEFSWPWLENVETVLQDLQTAMTSLELAAGTSSSAPSVPGDASLGSSDANPDASTSQSTIVHKPAASLGSSQ